MQTSYRAWLKRSIYLDRGVYPAGGFLVGFASPSARLSVTRQFDHDDAVMDLLRRISYFVNELR